MSANPKQIAARVVAALREQSRFVPIGVSNRHIHLCRADMDALFGKGAELTFKSALKQPGQFASAETLIVKGPKGKLERVRVLGPLRPETQVEISLTDSYALGVPAPIRESGDISGTPGVELIGPTGPIAIGRGLIAARRHIHIDTATARLLGFKDKSSAIVRIGGERSAILPSVLLRASDAFVPEMHLDTDEANALCLKNNDLAEIMLI